LRIISLYFARNATTARGQANSKSYQAQPTHNP
jgi:hypothetical protein